MFEQAKNLLATHWDPDDLVGSKNEKGERLYGLAGALLVSAPDYSTYVQACELLRFKCGMSETLPQSRTPCQPETLT